nr:hypothetical protein [uncultured Duganella sp.]
MRTVETPAPAYAKLFQSGRLSMGLMTPPARKPGQCADVAIELAVARRAGSYGFAALWASQTAPLGAEGGQVVLDDPFVWLAAIGAAAPGVALAAQLELSPDGVTPWLGAARSLQRMSGGRCVLGVRETGHTTSARLRLQQALAGQAEQPIALLQLDGRAASPAQPLVHTLYLELDERAGAPAQQSGQRLRGGRLALAGELERLAEAGVAHVLVHLLRNGRPVLDVIDELGTEVVPRLPQAVSP